MPEILDHFPYSSLDSKGKIFRLVVAIQIYIGIQQWSISLDVYVAMLPSQQKHNLNSCDRQAGESTHVTHQCHCKYKKYLCKSFYTCTASIKTGHIKKAIEANWGVIILWPFQTLYYLLPEKVASASHPRLTIPLFRCYFNYPRKCSLHETVFCFVLFSSSLAKLSY